MEKKVERHSRQRELILRILKGTAIHPTAEWLYFQAKRKMPRLSLGTVYRNLNHLSQNGAIKKYSFGTPFEHFDGNISPHQHFVCEGCGRIYDLCLDLEKELKAKAKKVRGFKVEKVEVEFHGVCPGCLKPSK
jgi:Fur family peroxide stress response transcriptional regulator